MQESRLTEIIPFICISAIWGQYPEFFTFSPDPSSHHKEQLQPDGQGGLAFCNSWGSKESNMTEHTHTLRNGVFPTMSINKDVRAIRDSGPPNVNF